MKYNQICAIKPMSNNALDIIRVIAMTGIVVDHYFQNSGKPILVRTGLQLGGVFLMVFFAISAYLYGMKWKKGDYKGFGIKSFLQKRSLRIYIPLWLTLPIVLIVEYLICHAIDVNTIIFNVVGLGWFKPFGVAGHLWFITLMMFLYLVFLVFSRIRQEKLHMWYWLAGYVVLTALYVCGGKYFLTFSAVGPVVTIFFASLLFFKGEELTEYCRRKSMLLVVVTVVAFVLSWWMYLQGWHDTHKALAAFSSFSAGFALFMCLLTIIKVIRCSWIVKHFADISYEVYLVHLPLLPLASYVLKQFDCDSSVLIIPVWLLLTWLCAVGVHKATRRITITTDKKRYE